MRSAWRMTVPIMASGAVILAGCSSEDSQPTDAADSAKGGAAELELKDGWVKASDDKMTAAFGTLRNDSDEEIVLTGVSSKVSNKGELHVTEDDGSGNMEMKPAEGGFTVPAGGEHELAPGADHFMLMDLTEPLDTGTDATVTVVAESGAEWSFELPVREFSGAEESYDPGGDE